MSPVRPVGLAHGPIRLRPLRRRDGSAWLELRLANEEWLRPWEATPPGRPTMDWQLRHTPATYTALLRRQRAHLRAGTHLPFGIFLDGQLVGNVHAAQIVREAVGSASVGYWMDSRHAGRGIMPVALALLADHCFGTLRLHRLEANIRPENTASLAVVGKLGFTEEGLRRRYLAVDGTWRDHLSFALLSDDHPGGVLRALLARTSRSQPS